MYVNYEVKSIANSFSILSLHGFSNISGSHFVRQWLTFPIITARIPKDAGRLFFLHLSVHSRRVRRERGTPASSPRYLLVGTPGEHRMREGYVFTPVCPFTEGGKGEGYPSLKSQVPSGRNP